MTIYSDVCGTAFTPSPNEIDMVIRHLHGPGIWTPMMQTIYDLMLSGF